MTKKEVDFEPNDMIRVRVVPNTDSYVIPNSIPSKHDPKKLEAPHVVTKDKPEAEVLAKDYLNILKDLEPNQDQWERMLEDFEEIKKDAWKKLLIKHEGDENTAKAEFDIWMIREHPAKNWFSLKRRSVFPLKSAEVLENLGPRPDDIEYRMKKKDDMDELTREFMRKWIEDKNKEESSKQQKASQSKSTASKSK